ncbi:ESPR domain-containing protein [Salmonella enterica]
MNRVYRLVWSHVAGSFVAVGEHAKSHVSGGGPGQASASAETVIFKPYSPSLLRFS